MAATEQLPPAAGATLPAHDSDYWRLFNLSLDLLAVAGLDGYFKKVNPAWTRVLGWSEAELLARPVADIMHPDDRERTLAARAGLAKGVLVRGLENRYLCKDGSFRWLSWQSAVELAENKVFAVARDITDRLQQEREQLILSKLESGGILAGGMAHDFNNLLGGMLLSLEMIGVSGATNEEQKQYLRQAREAVYAAEGLTKQLIMFAQGDDSVRRPTDLRSLLQQAIDVTLRDSAVQAVCAWAPDLHRVDVDDAQMSQVIRNLVQNAREATLGRGVLRVEAKNVVVPVHGGFSPGRDFVRIVIADNGPGIEPEIAVRIFDPYFSTKPRGSQKGMGLGLTVCRAVVHKHGGTIAVASTPGQGTVVTLDLPATTATPDEPATAPAEEEWRAGRRILVMDDEPLFREAVGQALRRLGCEVDLVMEGDEALLRYEKATREGSPYAAVLLDLTVRDGKGGAETINLLRSRDPGVRAVLMTGYSHEDTFRNYAAHGFSGALSKPFSVDTLRALLTKILAPTAR